MTDNRTGSSNAQTYLYTRKLAQDRLHNRLSSYEPTIPLLIHTWVV